MVVSGQLCARLETVAADDTLATYTDDELCAMLRRLATTVDGPLTVQHVEEADDCPDPTTFERRFGSWNQAKEAAGLQPVAKGQQPREPTYSNQELLQRLRERAAEIEGPLTKDEMNTAADYPSASTYVRRFGSWTAAKERAGIGDSRSD